MNENQISAYFSQAMNDKKWCRVCSVELKSMMHAQTHYFSANHTKKLQQHGTALQQLAIPLLHQLNSYCSVCNLYVGGDPVINGHLNTEQHKRKSELYCTVCKVRSKSKYAFEEHKKYSLSHLKAVKSQNNRLQSNFSVQQSSSEAISYNAIVGEDNFYISQVCSTSTTRVKEPQKQMEIYCSVCGINYLIEKFYAHLSKFPHTAMDMLNTQCSCPMKDFCSIIDKKAISCNLCNVRMNSINDVKTHLRGAKHLKNFKSQFVVSKERPIKSVKKDTAQKRLIAVSNKNHIDNDNKIIRDEIVKVNTDTHKKNEQNSTDEILKYNEVVKEENEKPLRPVRDVKTTGDVIVKKYAETEDKVKGILGTNKFVCYLCKLNFNNKIQLNVHAIRFPHVEMAKWKSEVVSVGVHYAEYWVFSETSLTCTLCNVEICNTAESMSHMGDAKHKSNVAEWCKEFASWKFGDLIDPKFFYCTCCDLRLPGTSEAKYHYHSNTHLQKVTVNCKTEQELLEQRMSLGHKANICEETVFNRNPIIENIQNEQEGQTPQAAEFGNKSIEGQILQQVDKLVNSLCCSRVVPLNVTLDYLKKINFEVEQLKDEYEKKTSKPKHFANINLPANSPFDNLDIDNQINMLLDQKFNEEDTLESFITNKHTEEGPLRVIFNGNHNNSTEETAYGREIYKNTNLREENKSETPLKLEKDSDFLEKDFFSRYLELIESRLRITLLPSIERDVLNELKHLINIVNAQVAPLNNIFNVVRNFNTDLDSTVLKFKYKRLSI